MLIGNVQFVVGRADRIDAVLQLLRSEGIEPSKNPDVSIRQFGTFGIDDARQLQEKAAMRAVGQKQRYFVAIVDAITAEAQNALLKTLEDPPADAIFIFIHPAPQTLLPTVRSRAQFLDVGVRAENGGAIDAGQFLKATPAKRLDMLKPLLEKGDDDRRDLGIIFVFLSALEKTLARGNEEGLHAIYRARRYIGDRGALVKPLLEQVALLV